MEALIPDFLSHYVFYGLIILSCFTSMLSISIGLGGGTIMLAVMAQLLPVAAIIPIHGTVQLGSNFGRAIVMVPHVNRHLLGWFLLGSICGAFLGGQIVISLPTAILQAVLGTFILLSVWNPSLKIYKPSDGGLFVGGLLSTVLTMFVGATGPFVMAMLRGFALSPQRLVSTSAACMVIQHILKVFVFGLLGFAFAPYLPLIVLMVASGFVGTIIGRRLLLKVDEVKFKRGLSIVLTILALRLLMNSVT